MTTKYKRKLTVFIICIVVGLGAGYIMPEAKYKIFFENIVYIAIGFFVANGIEHTAKAFKIRKNGGSNS